MNRRYKQIERAVLHQLQREIQATLQDGGRRFTIKSFRNYVMVDGKPVKIKFHK